MANVFIKTVLLLTAMTKAKTWSINYTVSNILFASDIYEQLANKQEDFIISPITLQSSLALLTTGAKGQTFVELCRTLYLPKSLSKIEDTFSNIFHRFPVFNPVAIDIPIKVYFNKKYNINSDFKSTATNVFKSAIENVNFKHTSEVISEINEWVSIKTKKPISAVDNKTVTASTKLVVINSLFVKGKWLNPFDKTIPLSVDFYLNETYSEVTDMHTIVTNFGYHKDDILDAEFLDIPLQDYNTCLTLILPNQINGLQKLEENIYSVLNTKTRKNTTIYAIIPDISSESNINFVDTLKSLGLVMPFDNNANFQNIVDDSNFHLENIIQNIQIKANRIGVNAEGFEELTRNTEVTPTQTFTANRPFIYAVSNNDGGILLLGRYSRPPK